MRAVLRPARASKNAREPGFGSAAASVVAPSASLPRNATRTAPPFRPASTRRATSTSLALALTSGVTFAAWWPRAWRETSAARATAAAAISGEA